ncbi:MAG TPA: P-loop NTPase fold protein, partial [Allosphingosinicella sp.]|nr:P-loop NTPase fold protein [Allosphingosinicella sp.]
MLPTISQLAEEVLREPDFQAEIGYAPGDPDSRFVAAQLVERTRIIEGEASNDLSALTEAQRALATATASLAIEDRRRWFERATAWLWSLALVGGPIAFLLWGFGIVDFELWLNAKLGSGGPTVLAVLGWFFVAPAIALSVLTLWWRGIGRPGRKSDLASALQIDELKARERAAEVQALDRLRSSVSSNARAVINETKSRFFQPLLVLAAHPEAADPTHRAVNARGLSEVDDPIREVSTTYRQDLLELIQKMSGGSIGLSGPRGVGKSTLLRSICGTLEIDGKEAIAVYTTSPVKYDPREFLLHLFSLVCRQVLRSLGAPDRREVPGQDDHHSMAAARYTAIARPLILAGLASGGLGLMFATAMVYFSPESSHPAGGNQSPPPDPSVAHEFLKALAIVPGPLLLLGLASILVGAVLLLRRPAFLRSENYRPEADLGTSTILNSSRLRLVEVTQEHLRDIRFQRSYTSGWSGALKVPVGIEMGGSSSLAMSQRQESLPELVERFRSYIERLGDDYHRILIAIDELDKLSTTVDAETFLNEVKVIFSIKKCFYFVSVSENAVSSFERRGLALRDAFDSAFDEIRYMAPLTLDESRKLLGRRIFNFPDQFVCLCHILSGGLPR